MTSTSLPPGTTCGTCVYFRQCSSHFNRLAADTECEHAPAIYRPDPAALRSARPAKRVSAWNPRDSSKVVTARRAMVRSTIVRRAPIDSQAWQFPLFGGAA